MAQPLDRQESVHNLPLQLTSFVGRDAELADVERLLGATRLLTLTGAGGVGKTRLALEAASRCAAQFRDGVCLVELAPLADASLVPSAIAAALGLAEGPGRSPADAIATRLREREILLVLDNCEHLIDACARLADTLLRSCLNLRLLATSRESLGIPGEVTWLLPSLSLPPSDGTSSNPPRVEGLLEYDAVRLLVQRSKSALPSFSLTTQNAAAVAEVCRQLDGIPLALELAAARVRALTMDQIAVRLGDRFRLLTAGARTADRRHQTLGSLIDWSYDLLSQPEQTLLRRLSVFAGGWTLEAAEAICGAEPLQEDQILELLSLLVDKSLVLAQPEGGEERYDLYETLRQYAAEKLEQLGEAAAVRHRHLQWFRDLAEALGPRIQGPEGPTVFGRLEAELANIRAAIDASQTDPDATADGLRLAAAPLQFWWMCGHAQEAERCLRSLLDLPSPGGADGNRSLLAARAAALTTLGFVFGRQRRADAAVPVISESLDLWRQIGDQRRIAFSLRELGIVVALAGDPETGQPLLEQSLALARQLGVRPLIYEALLHLGMVVRMRGEFEWAQALFEESLRLGEQQGDVRRVAISQLHLGSLALKRGSFTVAKRWLRDSLTVSQEAGVKVGFAPAFNLLAWLAVLESHPERAFRLAGAADAARDALGSYEPEDADTNAETHRLLEQARQSLGAEAAATARSEGLAMTAAQAIEFALADEPDVAAETPDPSDPLTAREREVATLVARGLTNRQIAAELVIAEGTAKRHVENILSRLGLDSRAQLAAWASASESARGSTSSP